MTDLAPHAGLRFRAATANDLSRLVTVVNAAFALETFLEGTRTDAPRLAEMLAAGRILLAEEAGCLLGALYMEFRGQRGYLGMLAVDPGSQCRGLARQLVAQAEVEFRRAGCREVEISVLSLRPELPPIYRRYGYVESHTEELHLTQPLRPGLSGHSIVMLKQLSASKPAPGA